MNAWDKPWGQADRPSGWLERLSLDTGDWRSVYSACLGKMTAIQTACGRQVVRGEDWHVDFTEGVIRFGSRPYPLQFLGSEAAADNTWLWGWENINGFPEAVLRLARQTRETGLRWGLEPLTTAEFPLDGTFHGHALAAVACGLAEGCCYYRCPHAGGAVFAAFSGAPGGVFAPVDAQTFVHITMQCIQQCRIDHRLFTEGFLLWNRTPCAWSGQTLTAHFPQPLTITFEPAADGLRICAMNTVLPGRQPGAPGGECSGGILR